MLNTLNDFQVILMSPEPSAMSKNEEINTKKNSLTYEDKIKTLHVVNHRNRAKYFQ